MCSHKECPLDHRFDGVMTKIFDAKNRMESMCTVAFFESVSHSFVEISLPGDDCLDECNEVTRPEFVAESLPRLKLELAC